MCPARHTACQAAAATICYPGQRLRKQTTAVPACARPCAHTHTPRHLVVDGPSLAALDIFKEEEHPSAMGIGSSKEGVSLYGLLQRCVTGMVCGHRLSGWAPRWLLQA